MRVLIAGEIDARAEALTRHLGDAGVEQIMRVAAGERLIEAVKRHAPDVVIVDLSTANRDGLEALREVSATEPRPIVMFSDSCDPALIEDAVAAGVSSYHVRGTSLPAVKPMIQAAVAIFRRYQKAAGDLRLAELRLDEHAAIQEAKSRLMRDRKFSEAKAYNWLRKRAMDRGRRIADVARELLASG